MNNLQGATKSSREPPRMINLAAEDLAKHTQTSASRMGSASRGRSLGEKEAYRDRDLNTGLKTNTDIPVLLLYFSLSARGFEDLHLQTWIDRYLSTGLGNHGIENLVRQTDR